MDKVNPSANFQNDHNEDNEAIANNLGNGITSGEQDLYTP